jgi:hypothetical protein
MCTRAALYRAANAAVLFVLLFGAPRAARAEQIVRRTLGASLDNGSLALTPFPISYTYDADQVSADGDSTVTLLSFDFSLNGIPFTRDAMWSPGQALFRNGVLFNIKATFGGEYGAGMPAGSPVTRISFGLGGSGEITYADLYQGSGTGSFGPATQYRITGVVTSDLGEVLAGARVFIDVRSSPGVQRTVTQQTDATAFITSTRCCSRDGSPAPA